MASLPLSPEPVRHSASRLPGDSATAARVAQTIAELLAERAPYQRVGYPRAGAFDRLALLAFWNSGAVGLAGRYWLPAPRIVLARDFQLPGRVECLVQGDTRDSLNVLILAGIRMSPGAMKYGSRNSAFARLEQGIFLQALHLALCRQAIPNHMQGGLDALPLRLPWDIEEWAGLAA